MKQLVISIQNIKHSTENVTGGHQIQRQYITSQNVTSVKTDLVLVLDESDTGSDVNRRPSGFFK